MPASTALFDLDGTVIDSGPLIAASFRHAVEAVLGEVPPDEELLAYVGGWSLREQMARFAPHRVDELVEAYRAHNEPAHARLGFCPGMRELLAGLSRDGMRLGLVTAKRRSTVEVAFGVLPELEGLFNAVVTAEETDRHKPHPEPLLLALEKLDGTPAATGAALGTPAGDREARKQVPYVGDSPFDVEAARAAGLRSIAVTWGGIHTLERLRAARPDAIVSTPRELRDALAPAA